LRVSLIDLTCGEQIPPIEPIAPNW